MLLQNVYILALLTRPSREMEKRKVTDKTKINVGVFIEIEELRGNGTYSYFLSIETLFKAFFFKKKTTLEGRKSLSGFPQNSLLICSSYIFFFNFQFIQVYISQVIFLMLKPVVFVYLVL